MTTNHTTTIHITTGRRQKPGRGRALAVGASVAALSLLATAVPGGALGLTDPVGLGGAAEEGPPGQAYDVIEAALPPIAQIMAMATPLELGPVPDSADPAIVDGPDGLEATVDPEAPTGGGEAHTDVAGTPDSAAAGDGAASGSNQNGLWPGRYDRNPNRQVGRLLFDVRRGAGEKWSSCSATVVNAGNRSTVVTAGHCVYSPDPDNNGRVDGNGYWYEHVQFCPGYEYGCKLGRWHARKSWSTNSWVYGSSGNYAFHDDVAMVVLHRNDKGYVQDVTGAHGIVFNSSTGQRRYAFGYPAADRRWPQYRYNGEDLVYCDDVDTSDSRYRGTMWIDCTMTGGSSGGPWITAPNRSWLGYVNSVNSHKVHGGPYMNGPYFGKAEQQLFDYAKVR